MWICVFNETDTRFCLRKDTGTMNRPLRLTVCSLRISRIVRWHFVECSQCFGNPSATFWQSVRNVLAIRQQCFGRLSAAVGADLSRPHIRKHPQNDERKCACGEMNTHI